MVSLISIIVPVYNVESYIGRCVNSILEQTYKNLEIVLVDDGSTDSGPRICDDFQAKDSRIVVIHKKNGGLSSARNAGLDIAKGKYIGFVDSDDFIDGTMYEKLYHAARANDADLSVCSFLRVDEEGNPWKWTEEPIKDEMLDRKGFFERYYEDPAPYVVACSKLYKREIFDGLRFKEGILHEDEELLCKAIDRCDKIACISDILYFYVQRENSIMQKKDDMRHLDAIDIFADRIKFFREKYPEQTLLALRKSYRCLQSYIRAYAFCGIPRKYWRSYFDTLLGMLRHDTLRGIKLLLITIKHFGFKTMLKKILRRIGLIFEPIRRYFKSGLIRLKRDASRQRLIVLYLPEHTNIGDHMIAVAQDRFFDRELPEELNSRRHEFSEHDWHCLKKHIIRAVKKDDIIVIPGGGYFGTLWENVEDDMIDIISSFRDNHIIIFPQTVFFEDGIKGNQCALELKNVIGGCKDLMFFVRDRASRGALLKYGIMDESKCLLVPDIVTYYDYERTLPRNDTILVLLRKDRESCLPAGTRKAVQDLGKNSGHQVVYIDMHHPSNVEKNGREKVVLDKLEEFARASLVITDRLHAMLFSAITGTPCIAFDNVSGKVSGQYEWLSGLSYICQIDASDFSLGLVDEMFRKKGSYDNEGFRPYYSLIKDVFKKRILW